MQASPAETRRHRRREEARRAILDATEALMVESGSSDFSIRKLAGRCGYTAPTIYHYFGDKEGVVAALLEERFTRLLDSVREEEMGPDAVDNLRRMVQSFTEFGEQNPTFYRLVVAGRSDGADRTPPAAEAARALLEEPWLELAREGRLHCPDARTAAQALWALLHGMTALRAARPEYDWADDLFEVAVDSLLRGLIKPAHPRSH